MSQLSTEPAKNAKASDASHRPFKKNTPEGRRIAQKIPPMGKELSFAAAEAYKLLRTNLAFSLADKQRCRVVGITSSMAGEGKSTTAINLAYMLAEAGNWVLLIDGDMRRPTVAQRLRQAQSPGLSNLLVGLSGLDSVIQGTLLSTHLRVIAAGDIPPNPSELLGSVQMQSALKDLSSDFDFIILDLPPVAVVSDALVLSRLTDGMIMVVRKDYTNRRILDDAMRQLKFANVRVLGFVMNHADGGGTRYGRYGKYGKYGRYQKYGNYGEYGNGGEDRCADSGRAQDQSISQP